MKDSKCVEDGGVKIGAAGVVKNDMAQPSFKMKTVKLDARQHQQQTAQQYDGTIQPKSFLQRQEQVNKTFGCGNQASQDFVAGYFLGLALGSKRKAGIDFIPQKHLKFQKIEEQQREQLQRQQSQQLQQDKVVGEEDQNGSNDTSNNQVTIHQDKITADAENNLDVQQQCGEVNGGNGGGGVQARVSEVYEGKCRKLFNGEISFIKVLENIQNKYGNIQDLGDNEANMIRRLFGEIQAMELDIRKTTYDIENNIKQGLQIILISGTADIIERAAAVYVSDLNQFYKKVATLRFKMLMVEEFIKEIAIPRKLTEKN